MPRELAKQYNPREVEDRIYDFWMDKDYFHGKLDTTKESYTIVMPPPNITGVLHMGHALNNTLQDILIRWRRMQGFDALWVPGTDHASIATEVKIVETMKKEGLTKEDVGREAFLKRAWEWKAEYGGTIIEQLKKLGASADWKRERFTMDEGCSVAVREEFNRLYEKGLIYRGERMINWCTDCQTSLSDAEVEHEEREGNFWHLRYPLEDGSGYIALATTRPETMLGDTAVAVHPDDERYQNLIGKNVILPLVNRLIPIVADTYVDPEFGTGAVKITPAHDPNDFEIGQRHDLPIITVMTEDGHMNELAGEYEGMPIYEARKQIVKDLEKNGVLEKVEPMTHNVGVCYRCGTVVEPRISLQWFVKMEPLAKPAIETVKNGDIEFIPKRMERVYYNWLENIHDWCISRQLWWGHRIPAWYCDNCGHMTVSREENLQHCEKCNSTDIKQDPDVLDTWFSSALWPFSTLGWPEKTLELAHYYPTSTLVTAYDILFFWVARMIFSGLEFTDTDPFHTVFYHGLVLDDQGRKMSKSLGNGIDPLEIIHEYGADALRFTLSTGNSPGNDMRFSYDRVEASRNFANKIWNAARFILMNLDEADTDTTLPQIQVLTMEDKWILSQYNRVVKEVTENLEHFELGIAVQKLYDFLWDVFCDWYIELAKIRLQSDDEQIRKQVKRVLIYVLSNTLKLLHPFMPFITEEIWQTLPHDGEALIIASWPEYQEILNFTEAETEMDRIMAAVKAIRQQRAEMNVPPSRKADVIIDTTYTSTFEKSVPILQKLAFADNVTVGMTEELDNVVSIVTADARLFIPMGDLVDFEAERERLKKEIEDTHSEVNRAKGKLANEKFTSKAPEAIVQRERDNLVKYQEKLKMLEESLAKIEASL